MSNDTENRADCHKNAQLKLERLFLAKAGAALWRILCNAFKTLLTGVRAVFQAQVQVVTATLSLQEVFIENFVVFPARSVGSTLTKAADTGRKLSEFGLDKRCAPYKDIHDEAAASTSMVRAAGRRLTNMADQGEDLIEELRDRIERLQRNLDTLTDRIDIECP